MYVCLEQMLTFVLSLPEQDCNWMSTECQGMGWGLSKHVVTAFVRTNSNISKQFC